MQNIGRLKLRLCMIRSCSTRSDGDTTISLKNKEHTQQIKTTLNQRHRIIAEGGIPPITYETERNKWAIQERFGKYGIQSGVDIRKLWPSIEEVEEINAFRLYRKVPDAVKLSKDGRAVKEKVLRKRLAKLEKQSANYPTKLKAYEKSLIVEDKSTPKLNKKEEKSPTEKKKKAK